MRNFLFVIISFLANLTLQSSGGLDLYFNHLTTESGLSNNTIPCIFQDRKGYIWFGKDDGLNMFDGYEFTIYKFNSSDRNSLSSNSVFNILEDSRGQLWIAASSGVDIFSRESKSFRHIPFLETDLYERYESYVRAIVEDQRGNIFIANTNGFLDTIPQIGGLYSSIRILLIMVLHNRKASGHFLFTTATGYGSVRLAMAFMAMI